MKLYNDTKAPNPRRVRIFLAEKRIEPELIDIDILKGEHKQAAYTGVNALQRLPVLELEDGTRIAETVAICRYLEQIRPEPPLMGRDDIDKVKVEQWQRHIEFHLLWTASQVTRHLIPALKVIEDPQVPDWGRANEPRVKQAYDWLDNVLGTRAYCAGEDFTIADITALCAIDFARFARVGIEPRHKHLAAWYEKVSARPSARA
jgi:glutathione S-transferase